MKTLFTFVSLRFLSATQHDTVILRGFFMRCITNSAAAIWRRISSTLSKDVPFSAFGKIIINSSGVHRYMHASGSREQIFLLIIIIISLTSAFEKACKRCL